MREAFVGYHPPNSGELDRIWSSALVVVDTNVLLNLYRLSPQAREKLLSVLEAYADRIWMPYQVGVEFHDNRVGEIRNQRVMGSRLLEVLQGFPNAFSKVLQDYALNADVKFLEDEFIRTISEFSKSVEAAHSEHLYRYGVTPQSDSILARLEVLFQGRVGRSWEAEKLEQLYAEAEVRYSKKIPPGFQDAKNKQAPRKYGDYVLWSQILHKAKSDELDVLFVTDDKKSDWWWESQGQILGPEPQLRDEFKSVSGRLFYAYRSSQFIRESDRRRAVPVNEEIVEEIQTTSDAYAERERAVSTLARDVAEARRALAVAHETLDNAAQNHMQSVAMLNRADEVRSMLATEAAMLRRKLDGLQGENASDSHEHLEKIVAVESDLHRIEVERAAANDRVEQSKMVLDESTTTYKICRREVDYLEHVLVETESRLRSIDLQKEKRS